VQLNFFKFIIISQKGSIFFHAKEYIKFDILLVFFSCAIAECLFRSIQPSSSGNIRPGVLETFGRKADIK
jgi:hypothetical protein